MLYFVQGSPDGDDYKELLLGYDLTTGTMQELYAEEVHRLCGCL